MNEKRDLAVLVGNGLSTAVNGNLALGRITQEVLRRMEAEADNGTEVVAAMKELASRALPDGASTDSDFEVLVGALGFESRTLGYLDRLAAINVPDQEELRSAIILVRDFAAMVGDRGISHVLEVIFERSLATGANVRKLKALVAEMLDKFKGNVTFSSLNYDTLLLATLTAGWQREFADLAHGFRTVRASSGDGTSRVRAKLRSRLDFPKERRIRLLNLHGSLTFWDDGRSHHKLTVADITEEEPFACARSGALSSRPLVVLCNSKDKASYVTEAPFALAYEGFRLSLEAADHWLIIGYSFRDEPVNSVLAAVLAERKVAPRVHVVTFGADPALADVLRAMNPSSESRRRPEWLSIDREGALGAETSEDWDYFCGDN